MGDWDAFDVDHPQQKVGHAQVERILDGCVLRETYESNKGLAGQSLSMYDASRKVWHQSSVTNRGQLLVIEGTFNSGEMVLNGADHVAGRGGQVRGTWKRQGVDVRETAVESTDGGKTWKPWFDIVSRRHEL